MPHDPTLIGQHSDWFGAKPDGTPVTRQKKCEVCGKEFTQKILSERFMLMIERRGPTALAKLRLAIPDLWVPVYCPPCERMGLDHASRKVEQRGAA